MPHLDDRSLHAVACAQRESPRRASGLTKHLLLATLVVSLGSGTLAVAGTNRWTQHVLAGARVHDLEFSADGSDLWAATGGSGVFKSLDGGQTWSRLTALPSTQFLSISQSPSSSSAWICTTEEDVWSTADGGGSWRSLLTSSDAASLTATEFNLSSASTLYAVTAESLYKSINGGSTWSLADTGIEAENLRSAAPSPHNSSHLWVCGSAGPYLSTNDASSFTLKASGLDVLPHPICTEIAYHPTSSSSLYLGTWWGLFRSTDTGESWSRVASVPEVMVNRIVVVGGSPGVMFAATDDGLFRAYTNDDGTWTQVRPGAHYAVAAKSGYVVVADEYGDLFGSTDAGANWSALTPAGAADVVSLAMRGSTALAVTSDHAGICQRLYKSTDAGAKWGLVSTLPVGTQPTMVEIDAPGRVYVGSTHLTDNGQSGVFVSTDGGSTWSQTGMSGGSYSFQADFIEPYAIASHPTSSTVLAALHPDARSHTESDVFATSTGGTSWSGISPSVGGVQGVAVHSICLRGSGEIWLAGRGAGGTAEGAVVVSVNGGASWVRVGLATFTSMVSAVVLDPLAQQGNALVGTRRQGFLSTADGGLTWIPSNSGLTNLDVLCARGAAQATTTVYCGTRGGGAFKSVNGGASWTAMPSLPHSTILTLAVSSDGKTVLAGTSGGGVYHYQQSP